MNQSILRFALVTGAALTIGSPALGNHQWSTYHWNKGSGELAVPIGDNVTATWDGYLEVAVGNKKDGSDAGSAKSWNDSVAIQSPLVAGGTTARRCKAAAGRIEVCNLTYGQTGWLGIAGISISGGHITSGYTKLNDTYFNTAKYNTPEWRRLVTCQEIGHNYGLTHTDETFDNVNDGTCMDYTNAPAGGTLGGFNYGATNEYPNQHDYDMLNSSAMYGSGHPHSGAATNYGVREVGKAAPAAAEAGLEGGNNRADWGRAIAYDSEGRPHRFEKSEGGRKILTHVFWVPGFRPQGSR